MRVGMGYDVHKLVENRKLILGGVEIPYEYGLLGHSDADVLVHAIMDALLGAAALRDIGRHFPDNDPAYEGADSIELLKKVGEMLEERMYLIENIDATVIAQKPKLLPYIDTMVKNVAEALHLEEDQVNIKATTQLQVVLVKPELFTDAKQIADHLMANKTVVLNLESATEANRRRIIDFLVGVAYAQNGNIKPVANQTYIVTPYNVGFVGDEFVGELENNGLIM